MVRVGPVDGLGMVCARDEELIEGEERMEQETAVETKRLKNRRRKEHPIVNSNWLHWERATQRKSLIQTFEMQSRARPIQRLAAAAGQCSTEVCLQR